MISGLVQTCYRLLEAQQTKTTRFLFDSFDADRRLTGLIGPRGTGKTTLLLQYLKIRVPDVHKAMYASLDNIFFLENRLSDFVGQLYETQGRNIFFLDEVHKYALWNQEIKNIYDSYPDIRIVFTGSSCLDLVRGHHDLSRRGVLFRLPGLSFREYLNLVTGENFQKISLEQILDDPVALSARLGVFPMMAGHFKKYLEKGFYPFVFEEEATYFQRLLSIVDKTVYEDISNFYSLKTHNLKYFRKLIAFLASIKPGEVSVNNLSKNMAIDNKTVQHYLDILAETGLIMPIQGHGSGSSALRGHEKVFLGNPNLYHAVAREMGREPETGTIRETFFAGALTNAGHKVFHSKVGDFSVEGRVFEIGGKNKGRGQVRGAEGARVVKDGVLVAGEGEIPLYLFGFLY